MRRVRSLALAAVVLGLLVCVPGAQAAGSTVTGAGSTWAGIALGQWQSDAARLGISVNYQAVGSTAGRQFFISGQVDFAASEIPFLPSEVQTLHNEHKTFQYLPDVAGGTAFMYNLHDAAGRRITNLRLSAATIAAIFTGKITNWRDPAIRADNPGLTLPNEHLTPVIRSDGSGTSAKLADYLNYAAPSVWRPFAAANGVTYPVQFWPTFTGAVAEPLSNGVANYIASSATGNGAIGYVEAGFVYAHGLTPVYLRNRSGSYAAPSAENVGVALQHATLNADLTQNLIGVYNAPEANAYPLASYSYLITQTSGFDPAKGAVLGKWIIYIACAGQREAAPLGYSPLPKNLIADDFAAVRRIPGAPAPPAITPTACPNPTVTGQGYRGGHQQGSQGTQPSGSQAGAGSGPGGTQKHHHHHGRRTVHVPTPVAASGASSGVAVTPLSAAARRASYTAASHALAAARPAATSPLAFGAAALVLAILAPGAALRRFPRAVGGRRG